MGMLGMQHDAHSDWRLFDHTVMTRAESDQLLAKYRAAADRWGPDSKRALKLRNQLVQSNLKLVAMVARRFKVPHGWTSEDVRAWGIEGLIIAIEKYEPTHGAGLSTFAPYWVRHKIGRAMADLAFAVRVPVHAQQQLDDATKATSEAAAAARRMTSMNARLYTHDEDSRTTLGELLADQDAPEVTEAMVEVETSKRVRSAVELLPERLRTVIELRLEGLTLIEIGRRLDGGLSRERVRQLELQAHTIMRKALKVGERAA